MKSSNNDLSINDLNNNDLNNKVLSASVFKGLAKKLGILVAVVIIYTWFVNWSLFDETLVPELEALTKPTPLDMADNAYPLLVGLSSASDRDPFEVGEGVINLLRSKFEAKQRIELSDQEFEHLHGPREIDKQWQAELPSLSCNARLAMDCADQLINELDNKILDNERIQVLLSRYDTMLEQAHFRENKEMDAYTPLPDFTLLMRISRIKLALAYRNQSADDFIKTVAKDMAFWKLMLREGQLLIAKMVSIAGVRNDLQFLSVLMRQKDITLEQQALLTQLTQPFTPEELDIGETFLAESIYMVSSSNQDLLNEDSSWLISSLIRLTTQRNATANEYYTYMVVPTQLRATLSSEEFYQQGGYKALYYPFRTFPPSLYNLGGKITSKELANYRIQDYITRMHDMVGMISLAALQLEIETKPELPLAEVINRSVHRNPYTRQAMEYDSQTQTLGFDCLGFRSKDLCRIKL